MKSMTAYSSVCEESKWGTISWEIRSVNHRYLDTNFRLPDIFRPLEIELKKTAGKQLSRGKVECTLKFSPNENLPPEYNLNATTVKSLAKIITEIEDYFPENTVPINPLRILSWNNVLQTTESCPKALQNTVVKLFNDAITKLIIARAKEGTALQKTIKQKLQTILTEVAKVEKHHEDIRKKNSCRLSGYESQGSGYRDQVG